jgi:hypothetical protein
MNGGTLALGAYFGRPTESLARRLVGEQLEDGGWNCEAPMSTRSSFHTTICVLEGLLEYERAVGTAPEITTAKKRGEEYLLGLAARWIRYLRNWLVSLYSEMDLHRSASAKPAARQAAN